jgi:hypothetical protein
MQIQSEENYETIDCLFPKIYIFFLTQLIDNNIYNAANPQKRIRGSNNTKKAAKRNFKCEIFNIYIYIW